MITREDAIRIIQKAKRTHETWITYLSYHKSFPTKYVGDIAHHRKWIDDYNEVIEYLIKTHVH